MLPGRNRLMPPSISIIIPVYKVEDCLRPCLDSLLAQTFTDWEAICIDDGSPDQCGAILDEYAALDARFRIVHRANGGVSSARNEGLRLARAPLIAMIDSDDWADPRMLATLHAAINRDASDMAVCGHVEHGADGTDIVRAPLKHGKTATGKQPVNASIIESLSRYSWDKLLRRSIIEQHNLHYEEDIPFSEDHYFVQLYLLHAHTVTLVQEPLYHYRRRETSATLRFVEGKAPGFHYECAVNLLPRVADHFPPEMTTREKTMWYTALFAQNFHQIYLVKHVLKGKNHPETRQIDATIRRAFWELFCKTPKKAALRIIMQDIVRLARRILHR